MPNLVGDIAISVGADIGPLVRDLTKAKGEVSRFGSDVGAASGKMQSFSLAGKLMGAAVVAAGIGLAALTKNAIDAAGVLHDLSIQTGISVAKLQAMTQVAEEAGVAQEGLTSGIKKMQVSLGGLQAGTKAQVEAFDALGLSYSDFAGLSPDEQFAKLAESIAAIQDPMLKTNAAVDVFGKAGADLIPMMQGYGAAVAEAAAHQEALGIAMSDADAAQLDDLGDAMGRLGDSAQGAATQFAVAFGPAILEGVEFLTHAMEGLNAMFADFKAFMETTPEEGVFITIAKNTEKATAQLNRMADAYEGLLEGTISTEMRAIAENIKAQDEAFATGAISAEEYKTKMEASFARVTALIQQVEQLDGTSLTRAIGMMNGYAQSIGKALGLMKQLSMAGSVGATTGSAGASASASANVHIGNGPLTSTRPEHAPSGIGGIDWGAPVDTGGGGGGGGGGTDPMQGRIDALVNSLQTQSEIVNEWYLESQAALQAATDAELATIGGRQEAIERLEEEHQERLKGIKDAGNDFSVQSALEGGALILGAMASTNKKAAKAQAIFAAGAALMSTYQGAAKELEKGTFGFASAAAVIAKGIGFVAAIKNAGSSGGGGGSSGGSSGGGSSAAAAPSQGPLEVSLNTYGSGDFMAKLDVASMLSLLNKEAGDRGYRIMVPQ